MLPVRSIRLALGELLAADATTLAPAALGNKVALIAANFTPSEDLEIADLVLATFTGSAAKTATPGTQPAGVDPATDEQLVSIAEPIGGWRWECTADPVTPETIYGYALTNNAGTTLYGTQTLDTPITISAAGQEITVGAVQLRFNSQPIT